MGRFKPAHPVAAERPAQNFGRIVLMIFIFFDGNLIEIFFAEFFKMGAVALRNNVSFSKGGAFKLSRPYFSDVVAQSLAQRLVKRDFFNHGVSHTPASF